MPIAPVKCLKGHQSEIVYKITEGGAAKAAATRACPKCGDHLTMDWGNMAGGKVKMAFREGTYEIGDAKVYCSTKRQFEREVTKRGMYIRGWE